MKKFEELKYTDLKKSCKLNNLDFKTTEDLEPFNGIIGQERALTAVKTAMHITKPGFNLYLSGNIGMGKTAYALNVINKMAKKQKTPNDCCYIYNFDNPNEPILITLPAGEGRIFREDMNRFIKALRMEIASIFNSEDFEKEKKYIQERYETKKTDILKKFDEDALSKGFKIKNTPNGIYFLPIHNGVQLDETAYNALETSIKKEFEEKSILMQEKTTIVMKEIADLDITFKQELGSWKQNIATFTVSKCMNDLKIKYKKYLKIQNYLFSVQADVIKNIDNFVPNIKENVPQMPMRPEPKPWENYIVNLLVDNNNLLHAPVVRCINPTYSELFGKLEYENIMGGFKTNHCMLKPGLIHKANGGYLLINARDLVNNNIVWENFKKVIKNGEIQIDSSRDVAQNVAIVSLKPEPIKLDLQIVLIGGDNIYQQLFMVDPDFRKLFKIKADFEDTYDRTDSNMVKLAQYISYICMQYELPPLTKDAVEAVIEYSSRIVGDKNKLSAQQNLIKDIVIESADAAVMNKHKQVKSDDVKKATSLKNIRYGKINDNFEEMISDDTIIISTSGNKIGQINGLTIISTGECAFGKPVRITANTFIGKAGVINIEKEVAMSGNTHSKGVFILSAYIGEKFAQNSPLALTASICFEQLYNGVDGDSASSTELYAILSSLSDIPINQSLAVTGSVNQKGEIQPIGGVTDKIEGYFNVCKTRGLDGSHGVLIPYQNIKNLSLNDDIINAVKEGKFHIYPIKTVDEGIEILTGIPAGEINEDGTYPYGSVNHLAYEKLRNYAEKSSKIID